jgi:RNA polymerase sigma-70 factor, ECF subfamily
MMSSVTEVRGSEGYSTYQGVCVTEFRPQARCRTTTRDARVPRVAADDALLVARLAAGDDYALAEAFDSLGSAVYGAALRVLGDRVAAQDVVQDVFVELWRRPGRYNPAAAPLRTYLMVMARRRAVDRVRSEVRRFAREQRHHQLDRAQRPVSPGDEVAATETASLVRDAVRMLPDVQRQVVELAYFEGMSYREVGMAVGIPEGTAKSRLRLALAKLEAVLERELLEPS